MGCSLEDASKHLATCRSWDLLSEVMPSDCISLSIRRVLTPSR